jgi:hypothetical protein
MSFKPKIILYAMFATFIIIWIVAFVYAPKISIVLPHSNETVQLFIGEEASNYGHHKSGKDVTENYQIEYDEGYSTNHWGTTKFANIKYNSSKLSYAYQDTFSDSLNDGVPVPVQKYIYTCIKGPCHFYYNQIYASREYEYITCYDDGTYFASFQNNSNTGVGCPNEKELYDNVFQKLNLKKN